jgi:hypothetical protein
MERRRKAESLIFGAFAALFLLCAAAPAHSEVSVNINIGPPMVVQQAPEMVVVPGSLVYFAPGVNVELFFFRGYWWSRNENRWFRSREYKGPWKGMEGRRVPVEIVRLPPRYREEYGHREHIPYGQLKKHWEKREYEKRKQLGEWKKEEKQERREQEREFKEERRDRKEDKREQRGRGRND